ncbi:adhesion G-protein coupled receptor G1-like [Trichomycterus rosablanca]|uniref:adhesion G-protein coupled receptor G1-like n=1 Tax=Trichomycterus rosablanca TaxID=2290929 RepID=UPI002F3507E5
MVELSFKRTGRILLHILLTTLCVQGHAVATENDRDFKMCGTWVHRNGPLKLAANVTTGCAGVNISADDSTLLIQASITGRCETDRNIALENTSKISSHFCVFWDPLLDFLMVEINRRNYTLCTPDNLQTWCCTDLSAGRQGTTQEYGIQNGSVHGDPLSDKVLAFYVFEGNMINCMKAFCEKTTQVSSGANMIEDAVMKSGVVGRVDLSCIKSTVVEMNENFAGDNITFPVPRGVLPNMIPSIHLPASLKPAKTKKAKVVCTYHKNSTYFQKSSKKILEDNVVGISVENEIITNLVEPVRITFHHSPILANEIRKCVSWDTRKDTDIEWREDGCETVYLSSTNTECCCNHLTYFAILVEMNPGKTPRHLEALTFITAVGCAVSIISCAILFVSLCRQRRAKDQSSLVHRGLVVSLFFLCVLFILSGTVANVANERVCQFMAGLLHYVLLSVLCWMAVEVVHTFWMIHMVFSPSPKPWIWYLMGFGFPVIPVTILASMGNVYGERIITPTDVTIKPYRMCWMTDSHAAQLAHFITNVGLLALVVSSGSVMLVLVVWKIHNRDEWRRNCVAFLSIWGLSCLFGTTWALAFFSFDISETALFLFCIINSLQGFFLMLRFFALERMRKNTFGSDYSSSTGSTRQHMLQPQEKS